MSKPKLSIEEKKHRMLALFHETGECYQLKELEKVAPKAKGIVANTVKDVLQKLVDDGMVETDKIGTSVYFWSFPMSAINKKKRKLEETIKLAEESSKKRKLMEEVSKGMEDASVQLREVLSDITALQLELDPLKKQFENYTENDPDIFKIKCKNIEKLKDAANRWTDNIFACKSWCKKKFNIEDNVLNKQFGISEDLDYLE